ncbi:MAG TPA: adenosylcobinamide-GDP ribazoletransferase [Phycisphaerae bacterium]|nr:adenosylcobinamide-GDP ribazoletransferase [Phycisphaerae bacterium]
MPQNSPHNSSKPLPAVLLAARFLFLPPGERDGREPRWLLAAKWLPIWGLAIGVSYAVIFRLAWRMFGEYQRIRWLPAAIILALDLAICGRRLILGAIAAGRDPRGPDAQPEKPLYTSSLLLVLIVVLLKFAVLLSLPIGWEKPSDGPWRWDTFLARLGPLYPWSIYRPLVLAPLWGRWAMMLAMTIGRTAPGGSPRLRQMAGHASLTTVFAWWLLAAGLTVVYCSGSGEHLAHGVMLALVPLVVGYLAGFVLARRSDGQNEATVTTAALITEMTFLTAYAGVASDIYWW